jgi:hypothetical protein
MVELIGIAVILVGLVLLFAGAALSVYGVAVLGVMVGGGVGYLFAPTIGDVLGLGELLAVVVATAIGIVAGLVAAYLLLSMAVAALSFVVGVYAGLVLLSAFVGGDSVMIYPGALVVGIVAAALGSFLTKSVLVIVTSFVGATLVSGSLTVSAVTQASEQLTLEPLLFDVADPILLGLFALGILTQFGLFKFGYVTKLVGMLPGASVLTNRGETAEER